MLSVAQKRRIREDGYLTLPRLIPQRLVAEALREINHRLGQGRHQGMDPYGDALDYWTEDVGSPAIMALLFDSPLWGLAESLVGPGKLRRPATGQIALRFPAINYSHGGPAYHIDGFYSANAPSKKPISRFTMLTGVMLSDLNGEYMGNLAVCPGSHRQIAEFIARHGPERLSGGIPDVIDLPEPVQLTGKAGDAALLHYQLAHDKEQNLSPRIRYAVYFRLYHVDAEATQAEGLTDIWREWPAIRALARQGQKSLG